MRKAKRIHVAIAILLLCAVGVLVYIRYDKTHAVDVDAFLKEDDVLPQTPVPATPQEVASQPNEASALGGYNVLIADRGNNRVIEVTPDKQILWEYQFNGLPPGYGADDSFFADGGKTVIVNLEQYHLIEQIDFQTKKVVWQYGTPGVHGGTANHLYSPDDAYKLPSGDVRVADIKNCRIVEISPSKQIVHQYGKTRACVNEPGYLDAPNGDTPLPNGDILVSTILNHSVAELDPQGNVLFSMVLPLKYPSDPQLTRAGNILVAEYQKHGKIIEINRQGQIVWEYDGENNVSLNYPSLAIELPNGNILANDDLNHRVIVIDKQTKKIVWQFGVTGKPGDGQNQLNIPDGVDIIAANAQPASALPSYTVGAVTRHASQYISQQLVIKGYLLEREANYVLISDEATGSVSRYDLPVIGAGINALVPDHLYTFTGTLMDNGLSASNGNPDHFELTSVE